MAALNPYQAYRQNDVMTAGRYELVAKLYDGVLKFLYEAQKALGGNDIPAAHQALVRAQEIVAYLSESLDPKYEISANLAAVYTYINERLVEANLKKEAAIVAEVVPMVKDLSNTWRQAMNASSTDKADQNEA